MYESVLEKTISCATSFSPKCPKLVATWLFASALKALDGPFRAFFRRFGNRTFNMKSVPNPICIAERNPRLAHPIWARIHSHKEQWFPCGAVLFKIQLMRNLRVFRRVIHVMHRWFYKVDLLQTLIQICLDLQKSISQRLSRGFALAAGENP